MVLPAKTYLLHLEIDVCGSFLNCSENHTEVVYTSTTLLVRPVTIENITGLVVFFATIIIMLDHVVDANAADIYIYT